MPILRAIAAPVALLALAAVILIATTHSPGAHRFVSTAQAHTQVADRGCAPVRSLAAH